MVIYIFVLIPTTEIIYYFYQQVSLKLETEHFGIVMLHHQNGLLLLIKSVEHASYILIKMVKLKMGMASHYLVKYKRIYLSPTLINFSITRNRFFIICI